MDLVFNFIILIRSKVLGLAEVPNVKWEDIGGLEDVKAEILEAVSNIGVVGSKR
jgi:ATP-dependent 26S proteasome regulatory subunit